jgi:hypothetical protein
MIFIIFKLSNCQESCFGTNVPLYFTSPFMRIGMLVDIEYDKRKNNRLHRLISNASFDQPSASCWLWCKNALKPPVLK